MAEVLCEAVECFFNSGGLRSTCSKEVLRLDPEAIGSRRIFIPRTLPVRCMDYSEKPEIVSGVIWPYKGLDQKPQPSIPIGREADLRDIYETIP